MKHSTKIFRIATVVASFMVAALVSNVAWAQQTLPPGSMNIVWTKLPAGASQGSFVVEVGPGVTIDPLLRVYGPLFEAITGEKLTWKIVQAANPRSTIPICRIPGDGHRWNGRGDTSVWQGCAEENRSIALIAGFSGRIVIPAKAPETYDAREKRHEEQDACFKNADCLKAQAVKLGVKVEEDDPKKPSTDAKLKASKPAIDAAQQIADLVAGKDALSEENAKLVKENAEIKKPPRQQIWPLALTALAALVLGGSIGSVSARRSIAKPNAMIVYQRESERPTLVPDRPRPRTRDAEAPNAADAQITRYSWRIQELERLLLQARSANGTLVTENADFAERIRRLEARPIQQVVVHGSNVIINPPAEAPDIEAAPLSSQTADEVRRCLDEIGSNLDLDRGQLGDDDDASQRLTKPEIKRADQMSALDELTRRVAELETSLEARIAERDQAERDRDDAIQASAAMSATATSLASYDLESDLADQRELVRLQDEITMLRGTLEKIHVLGNAYSDAKSMYALEMRNLAALINEPPSELSDDALETRARDIRSRTEACKADVREAKCLLIDSLSEVLNADPAVVQGWFNEEPSEPMDEVVVFRDSSPTLEPPRLPKEARQPLPSYDDEVTTLLDRMKLVSEPPPSNSAEKTSDAIDKHLKGLHAIVHFDPILLTQDRFSWTSGFLAAPAKADLALVKHLGDDVVEEFNAFKGTIYELLCMLYSFNVRHKRLTLRPKPAPSHET